MFTDPSPSAESVRSTGYRLDVRVQTWSERTHEC